MPVQSCNLRFYESVGRYGHSRLCTKILSSSGLRLGKDVEPVLRAHIAASKYLCGITSPFSGDLNEDFMAGYAKLAERNLSDDNYFPNIERLLALAKLGSAFPDVTIIVNHLGGKIDSGAGDEDFNQWRAAIDAIAAGLNALMKVGGAQQRVGQWEPSFHINQRSASLGSE